MTYPRHITPGDVVLNKFRQQLTAISRSENDSEGRWHWRCYCGKTFKASRAKIVNGTVSSCGCYRREFQAPFEEGQIIRNALNRPIQALYSNKDGTWHFKCYCGRHFDAQASRVIAGSQVDVLSCGCHRRSKRSHPV